MKLELEHIHALVGKEALQAFESKIASTYNTI